VIHAPDDKKITTYKSFTIQFYDHLLSVLVQSLYATFTETKDGYIYLKEGPAIKDGKIKLDPSILSSLRELDVKTRDILDALHSVYQNDADRNAFISVQKSVLQFHGFIMLFKDKYYEDYIVTPYKADTSETVLLPLLKEDIS
jgi:hypothetical protein